MQLTAGRFVADATEQACAQYVQLCFGHGALESQYQAVIEQSWMVYPVGIADERVRQSAQIQQAVPISIVARQPGDFQTQHDTDLPEGHLGGHFGETGPLSEAGTGNTEVFIDYPDLVAPPTQCHG